MLPPVKSSTGQVVPTAAPLRRLRPQSLVLLLAVVLLTALLQSASAAPARPYAAPGDLQESAVTRSSLQLSWAPVAGAPGYRVRAAADGHKTLDFTTTTPKVKLTGLEWKTLYRITAYVEQPAADGVKATRLSDDSPETQVTTSTYARRAPDGLRAGKQTPTSVALSWSPVSDLKSGDRYLVEYGLNGAVTDSRRTAGPFSSTSTTLSKLPNNTTYFARVYVVDAAGKRISGSSDIVTAKSLVPRGTLKGKVSGAPTGDLQAIAYNSAGEAAGQVSVAGDGSYSLQVRPGSYKVRVQYIGGAGYTSGFATSGRAGSTVPSRATAVKVSYGATSTVPTVTLAKGATIRGVIKDPGGAVVRDVDVAALSADTSERVVVDVTRSDKSAYVLQGLPKGRYWLRFIYSGDGFRNRSLQQEVTVAGATITRNTSLENADFRSRPKPTVSGTKKVGQTLTVKVSPWLAGSYPTTTATMSYQWLRNGAAISGATATTYKLTSADKGKKISAKVTARRYGYATGSATSTAYAVA